MESETNRDGLKIKRGEGGRGDVVGHRHVRMTCWRDRMSCCSSRTLSWEPKYHKWMMTEVYVNSCLPSVVGEVHVYGNGEFIGETE